MSIPSYTDILNAIPVAGLNLDMKLVRGTRICTFDIADLGTITASKILTHAGPRYEIKLGENILDLPDSQKAQIFDRAYEEFDAHSDERDAEQRKHMLLTPEHLVLHSFKRN